jgi:4'-phosphopantetheinyl transferase EntD
MAEAMIPALGRVLPSGTGVGWTDPGIGYALMPGEGLPRAILPRLREFAAGRHAARLAMRNIGLPAAAIPHGPDRAPVWPAGVIGSITHTATACLAVSMRIGSQRGIGVDLEPSLPLPPTLWDTVLLPQEHASVLQVDDHHRGLVALRLFCAKEAIFKAHYPLTRALVGFEVMAVSLIGATFTGVFQTALPPFGRGDRVQGQILQGGGHILAVALL